MCSHGYFYRGKEKQTHTTFKNIKFVLLRTSHSLKVLYTSRISYRVLNLVFSRICSLKCGVPQGTIVGLPFFLIYINNLSNCLTSCQPRMYADDTHITYAGNAVNSIQQLNLNHDLGNLN